MPLRVQVFGAGSSPALQIGFTKISFTRPAAVDLRLPHAGRRDGVDQPAGAPTTARPSAPPRRQGHGHAEAGARQPPLHSGTPTVIGTGWTSVLELPADGGPGGLAGTILPS